MYDCIMSILTSDAVLELKGARFESKYAGKLLSDLGARVEVNIAEHGEHPAVGWAGSGLMHLVGVESSAPQLCPVPFPSCANAVILALESLSGQVVSGLNGAQLLVERAAILGLNKQGFISPGGSCHILETRDGHIALNLARDIDWQQLNALFQREVIASWESVKLAVRREMTESLVRQGRLLEFAIADAQPGLDSNPIWFEIVSRGAVSSAQRRKPRVLDLSSLWAGPLCGHMLHRMGADVIKVESCQRPDGARMGNVAFFDLLNEGKSSICLDLQAEDGVQRLRNLISSCDIVIESSRPRALAQMGICAEDMVRDVPGLSWISITGYGRCDSQANWIAFGDDAAIAAGLSQIMYEACAEWCVVGDAISDPLTGLHAALAAWASWQVGGGHLIALSLCQTVAHCIAATAPEDLNFKRRYEEWHRYLRQHDIAPLPPRGRTAVSSAAFLGADNQRLLSQVV